MNGLTYIVVEMQTYDNGQVGTIVTQKERYEDAQSVFHAALASAAISELPMHAVTILNNMGYVVETKYFVHEKVEPNS